MMDSSKTLIKTTDFYIDNNKTRFRALNQHIWMIYDKSFDNEGWSNGCWKFSFAFKGIN